jgi:hypothetical protein
MFYVPEHAKGEIEQAVAAIDRKHEGLTKREYMATHIAGAALTAANTAMQGAAQHGVDVTGDFDATVIAKMAVEITDALISELAKEPS